MKQGDLGTITKKDIIIIIQALDIMRLCRAQCPVNGHDQKCRLLQQQMSLPSTLLQQITLLLRLVCTSSTEADVHHHASC